MMLDTGATAADVRASLEEVGLDDADLPPVVAEVLASAGGRRTRR